MDVTITFEDGSEYEGPVYASADDAIEREILEPLGGGHVRPEFEFDIDAIFGEAFEYYQGREDANGNLHIDCAGFIPAKAIRDGDVDFWDIVSKYAYSGHIVVGSDTNAAGLPSEWGLYIEGREDDGPLTTFELDIEDLDDGDDWVDELTRVLRAEGWWVDTRLGRYTFSVSTCY